MHAITRLGSAELAVVRRPYTISQQALRTADAALAAGANSPVLWRLRLVASCGGEEVMQLRARWVCAGAAGVYRDLIGVVPNLSSSQCGRRSSYDGGPLGRRRRRDYGQAAAGSPQPLTARGSASG